MAHPRGDQSSPPFEGLRPDQIAVISTDEGARRAYDQLSHEKVVGFDTESKPTFIKGEKSKGPHLVQFATLDHGYIFLLHDRECQKIAGRLIELQTIKKVGFGLGDDLTRIRQKLGVRPRAILDVETLFASKGYGRGVGVKVGVAITFQQRFRKSKKVSTSNWMSPRLSDLQILYAANDAYAAIKVFQKLTTT